MTDIYKPRIEGFSFEWSVENLGFYTLEEMGLYSPTFTVDALGDTTFILNLRRQHIKSHDNLELRISRATNSGPESVSLTFDVTISDSGYPIQTSKMTLTFDKSLEMQSVVNWRKASNWPHDPLTISCHIYADKISQRDMEVSDESLSKDFSLLLQNKTLSDVELRCGGPIFKAHSAMLRAWSPVFANMLESVDGSTPVTRIDIEDMTSTVLEAVLKYIYSGKVEVNTTNLSYELHDVAKKYKIAELKRRLCPFPQEKRALTSVKSERIVFTWSVEDFSSLGTNKNFYSRVIRTATIPRSEMKLVLRIGGEGSSPEDVNLTVRRIFPERNHPLSVSCKAIVENSDNFILSCHRFQADANWHLPKFISKTWLYKRPERYLSSDTLVLRFEFTVSRGEFSSRIIGNTLSVETDVRNIHNSSDLSRRMIILRRSGKFEDCKIRTEDGEISAHSFVMCARSPVFSSMFETDMIEKQTGSVYIEDCDIDTVDGLLEYMYSGKMKDNSYESVCKQYALADKYQVLQLRDVCADILKDKITSRNVSDLLFLADAHNDERFRKYLVDYIRNHFDNESLVESWISEKTARPRLVRNLLWPDKKLHAKETKDSTEK